MGRIIIDRKGRRAVSALQRMRVTYCAVCQTNYSQLHHASCPTCKEKVKDEQPND
jgi:uncharacterized paraquat-inducible protein A